LFIAKYTEQKISEYINVYCRFRPPNESELSNSTNNSVILLSPKELIITQDKKLELKKNYIFDGLFEVDVSKEKFYEKTCRQIVDSFLQGYNGGIICYGETGTGKTYTIKEIIPQVISQIFEYIDDSDSNNELFKIDVSIIEIYKEQVNDLIDIKNTNLNLIEKKQKINNR
jgi:kinesin family protein 5